MKTLVILAHPNIEVSKVNQRWKEELLHTQAILQFMRFIKPILTGTLMFPENRSCWRHLIILFVWIIRKQAAREKAGLGHVHLVISRKITRGMVQCPLL